jgi:hypothetical protein
VVGNFVFRSERRTKGEELLELRAGSGAEKRAEQEKSRGLLDEYSNEHGVRHCLPFLYNTLRIKGIG